MKIHEYQAVGLFKKAGIPTSEGKVAVQLSEAVSIAKRLGYPIVLKAQVLVGGRGKAGGVKVVSTQKELEEKFEQIRKLNIKGYAVERIYVARALDIKKEYYLSCIVDNNASDVVVIASAAGGIDIEETAKTNPKAIKKFYLNGSRQPDAKQLTAFIHSVLTSPAHQKQAVDIAEKLIKLFFENDCSLAEINPLVVNEKNSLVAGDAKVVLDDNGLFRHKDLQALRDIKYEDLDELEAKEKNLSFVKLDGNVGCIVNGAGLAMATMDIVKLVGGQPANFLDVGGSSNPEKVLNALKIILKNKNIKAILINIFGGITRCDDIAQGIIQARAQINIPVPLVVRLTGTNEEIAKKMLLTEGIQTFATMREGVNRVVELARKV
ncbi:MAG TPA: ADP-forming succinate--CoA ligase subunit beta [Candidatus Omnitrophota bacterium]|nr:ADP-forming succinate--CoA ligase subunit beta [Candidatus Omnitrophota bacterium]